MRAAWNSASSDHTRGIEGNPEHESTIVSSSLHRSGSTPLANNYGEERSSSRCGRSSLPVLRRLLGDAERLVTREGVCATVWPATWSARAVITWLGVQTNLDWTKEISHGGTETRRETNLRRPYAHFPTPSLIITDEVADGSWNPDYP